MTATDTVTIRPMAEPDLDAADQIMRVAFGTFIGLPEPSAFLGDGQYVRGRWEADPESAFVAELDGEVVGSNFAVRWGSFGFFGPLTIRPDLWDRGIGRRLMEPVMGRFESWRLLLTGLFTFSNSPKHLALYQRYGYRPRHLTALMRGPVEGSAPARTTTRFSAHGLEERNGCLTGAFEITDALFDGLDVAHEICTIQRLGLGDTVFTWDGSALAGLACCHVGAGTEAGSGTCYVKFAAVRPGAAAAGDFAELMAACRALAVAHGAKRLVAGVNTARTECYEWLLGNGFRAEILGVAMHCPNVEGFSRPGVWVLDDWR